jgi:malonyl CoA-acyl carrier protein transacylase/SAM-dependent methyltransferase/NAD(P)-dependent dehydrogenase (short-subunit alcohol dehydrogenase family)/acyl carrier protein
VFEGFGGSNTHAIIESYDNSRRHNAHESSLRTEKCFPFTPFIFSATSESTLISTLRNHLDYLNAHNHEVNLRDLAWTLQYKRSQFSFIYPISATTHEDLVRQLEAAVKSPKIISRNTSCLSQAAQPRIMGIFTGQGSQWAKMGGDLILHSTYARNIIQKLDLALAALPELDRPRWKLTEELMVDTKTSRINEAVLSQPLTTAVQILLVDMLKVAGVKLHAVVGHSSGEMGAAYAAGWISAEDAIRAAYHRGIHASSAVGEDGKFGAMLATSLTPEQAEDLCKLPEFKGRIFPAAYNSPLSVTLSGDADAINAAHETVEDDKIFARKLLVDRAYHSHHMNPCAASYLKSLGPGAMVPSKLHNDFPTWFSSVHPGMRSGPHQQVPMSYWVDNATSPVRFSQAVTIAISEMGVPNLFIEFGPHPALEKPVRQIVDVHSPNAEVLYIGLLKRNSNSIMALSEALGFIWTKFGKAAVDLAEFDKTVSDGPQPMFLKELPSYPWQHDREYWWESRLLRKHYEAIFPPNELLGVEMSTGASHEMKWRQFLNPTQVPWILEHKLNDVPILPGAAYIAMATAAAQRICHKLNISVIEIQDLRLELPIAFVDRHSPIETVLTVSNITRNPDSTTAEFWIDFCSHQRLDELMAAAHGKLTIQHGVRPEEKHPKLFSEQLRSDLTAVDPKYFYDTISEAGYGYTGSFRCITSLNRRRNFASGELTLTPSELLFHPSILDGLFQGCLTADSFPGDSEMPKFNVPSFVRSMKIFPGRCENLFASCASLSFDVAATGTSEFAGALYSTSGRGPVIQMDGFMTAPFRLTTTEDDVKMYAEIVWMPYNPETALLESTYAENPPTKRALAIACERVSLYYLRILEDLVSHVMSSVQADRAMQHLLDFGRVVLSETRLDIMPDYMSREWLNDTKEKIGAIVERYSDSIDLQLIDRIGKAYPLIISGQKKALDTLLEKDGLNVYYRNGIGFPEALSSLGNVLRILSRRCPSMRILEVGAGTGSATGKALESSSCSSYTYTDVSPAFLGPAKEKFKQYADKMIFKVFDMDKEPSEQGYQHESFEVIIAANVLHASADVKGVLARIRPLLRSGGYLVCIELSVNRQLKNTVIMGGLLGWWLRHETERTWSPALSEKEWDTCLQQTGFSGIDSITPMSDDLLCPYRVFCTQAVDVQVWDLRNPLALRHLQSRNRLMIIVGRPFENLSLVDDIADLLKPYFLEKVWVKTLEEVGELTNIPYAVLSLVELGEPVFQSMNSKKWAALQKLFKQATDVLWVTTGVKSPKTLEMSYSSMMIGLARCVRHELRHLRLTMLDIDNPASVSATCLGKAMLRWYMLGQWALEGDMDNRMFVQEHEMAIENGVLLVPSVVRQTQQNIRYNTRHRRITHDLDPRNQAIVLHYIPLNNRYILREIPKLPTSKDESTVSIQVLYSTIHAVKIKSLGFFFLSIGVRNNQNVIILSDTISSILQVPRKAICSLKSSSKPRKHYLHSLAANLVADRVVRAAQSSHNILVVASDSLCLSLIQFKAAQNNKTVVFMTSNPDFERERAIYIHPDSLEITISHQIPSNTSVIFNLSSRPEDEVLFQRVSAIYQNCCVKIKSTSDIFRNYSSGYECFRISGSQSKEIAIKSLKTLPSVVDDLADLHAMSPTDVAQNSFSPSSFSIVDWESANMVSVQIQPATQMVNFSHVKTYLIIGTSDIAQSICEWLIDHGARYVILGSRTPSTNLITWAHSLASKGAFIDVHAVDVTDTTSISFMIASARAGANSRNIEMPAIGGVFHLGLELRDALFSKMTYEELQAVIDVKAKGSLNLHYEFIDTELDFFILTSSLSYVIGNPGQANYAAGNAYMVGLANYRRHMKLPASVVDLGRIAGIGYVARQSSCKQAVISKMLEKMSYPISERDIHEIFAEAVLASPADSGVNPEIITGIRDIEKGMIPHIAWGKDPKFASLISNAAPDTKEKLKPVLSIREQLGETITSMAYTNTALDQTASKSQPDDQIFDLIRTALLKHLCVLLQIDDINEKMSLLDLGIDSLVALEIGSWARKELQVQVPHSMIFGGASVVDVAGFVAKGLDMRWVGEQKRFKN